MWGHTTATLHEFFIIKEFHRFGVGKAHSLLEDKIGLEDATVLLGVSAEVMGRVFLKFQCFADQRNTESTCSQTQLNE
jgi:hypothetical protein